MKRIINLVVCIMLLFACVGQSQAGLFQIDFTDASGSDSGWDMVGADVTGVALTDVLGVDNDVTLSMTGYLGSNNPHGAGATVVDGFDVPASVNNDYMYGQNYNTVIDVEIKNLDAGTYNVSLFAGRTSDSGQHGTLWVGASGDQPGLTNTGNYANGSTTMELTVAAGQSLWFTHHAGQDWTGGTSGMIINPVPEPASMLLFGLGSLVVARRRRR